MLRTNTLIIAGLLLLLLFVAQALPGLTQPSAPEPLPTATVTVADQDLHLEIAATPQSMQRGLMFRDSLPEDAGMLFIWPREQPIAMWMKNTYIPLSVAFMDHDFVILNIADMQPLSLQQHPSAGPARYALEVNQGWFARHGIQAGDRLDGLAEWLYRSP